MIQHQGERFLGWPRGNDQQAFSIQIQSQSKGNNHEDRNQNNKHETKYQKPRTSGPKTSYQKPHNSGHKLTCPHSSRTASYDTFCVRVCG